MSDWLREGGWWFLLAITLAIDLVASARAILWKREPRSAALWLVVIWMVPWIGSMLFAVLGVNRLKRRAKAQRYEDARAAISAQENAGAAGLRCEADAVPEPFRPLARLVDGLVPRALATGNRIEPLIDGAQGYPAMLAAIDSARESVALASYIFQRHGIGMKFVEALGRAVARGVEVRVLLDDADTRFSWGSAARALRRARVTVGVFNPPLLLTRFRAANLRNHSKILVVDGLIGFTGGLNIAAAYWHESEPAKCSRDLHFQLEGPVVAHLAEVFAADWHFATGEILSGGKWFPPLVACGDVIARGIESGPDENFERLRWAILGALAGARRSVRILTPYFLPDTALIAALNTAAMRGVQVDILLPERNDLPVVQWAMHAQLWQVMEPGCRVWFQPGTFDHSKLMLVDDAWSLVGSANWDPRSLRLNFEFNVECYSAELGARLAAFIDSRRALARLATLAGMDTRSLPGKLRDGIARLFAPYL